jgi:hypothetical protein
VSDGVATPQRPQRARGRNEFSLGLEKVGEPIPQGGGVVFFVACDLFAFFENIKETQCLRA